MTDEEENKCLTEYKKLSCTNCDADCTISILDCYEYQSFFEGYEKGLTEGRKEICQKILEKIREHEGIEQMVKYNIAEIIKGLEEK